MALTRLVELVGHQERSNGSSPHPFSTALITRNCEMKRVLPSTPAMLTVADVAGRLQLCTKTVRRAIEVGELHVHQIGRQHRIAEDDLLLFIAKRRK
jgi:excisionase family DNA binding protein